MGNVVPVVAGELPLLTCAWVNILYKMASSPEFLHDHGLYPMALVKDSRELRVGWVIWETAQSKVVVGAAWV